jgi:hypothetical protein
MDDDSSSSVLVKEKEGNSYEVDLTKEPVLPYDSWKISKHNGKRILYDPSEIELISFSGLNLDGNATLLDCKKVLENEGSEYYALPGNFVDFLIEKNPAIPRDKWSSFYLVFLGTEYINGNNKPCVRSMNRTYENFGRTGDEQWNYKKFRLLSEKTGNFTRIVCIKKTLCY